KGAAVLAEGIRRNGKWMRDEALKRLDYLYPPLVITEVMTKDRPDLAPYIGEKVTVIAWIWARTVKSPNPAFANVDVPLASTFVLSAKPGRAAFIEPTVTNGDYSFKVRLDKPTERAAKGTKTAGANFVCLVSGTPI